jgi:predicted nucleic acid-binding protein
MRTYWDTSAAINAAVSPQVLRRLRTGDHTARLHLLAEFFATMTGRGVQITDEAGKTKRVRFSQMECADWLKAFARKVQFEELTKDEALEALEKTQSVGVQGGRIYDYWHALVAEKVNADELITRNTRDFQDLAKNVQWP